MTQWGRPYDLLMTHRVRPGDPFMTQCMSLCDSLII